MYDDVQLARYAPAGIDKVDVGLATHARVERDEPAVCNIPLALLQQVV